jgi:DNA-binding NarL/FixJ family response regulator
MSIRISIFEDNPDFRDALVKLINSTPEYKSVGAYYNCSNVIENLTTQRPDVILMDIDMPDYNGIEGLKKIRAVNRDVKVIMLTVFDDNKNVLDAICNGASGYILKKNAFKKLSSAIEEVMEGGAPLSSNIAKMILDYMHAAKLPAQHDFNLTAREKEILGSLVAGNSFKLIASALHIGMETVKTHIKNIYEKLQVHSQTEAVAKAIKNNIVK